MLLKKSLVLVGYFGFGNYGDELFLDVYRKYLPEYKLLVANKSLIPPLFDLESKKRIKKSKAIIIGGGDLIMPWHIGPLYWRKEYLSKPVFITGVGVPTWREEKQEVIDYLSEFFQHENVKYICCRDKESTQWVREKLKPKIPVFSSADLVCALDFNKAIPNPNQKILGLITRPQTNVDYNNSPVKTFYQKAVEQGYEIRHIVLAIGKTRNNDLKHINELDFSNNPIFCNSIDELTQELRKCSVLYSMKFHGCVAAFMMGIPVIAMSRADKFVSFMKDIGQAKYRCAATDPRLIEFLDKPVYTISDHQIESFRTQAINSLNQLKTELKKHI